MGEIKVMIVPCDFCTKSLDTSKDRWLFQDDGSYIHIDCIEPALAEYKAFLEKKIAEHDFKLLSKFDPREPFIENSVWHKTMSESQKHEDI